MRWLAALLLLAPVAAFELDGFCNYTAGESCMNSPDCSYCNVTLDVEVKYFGTYALVSAEMQNYEPQEVPLILSVEKDGRSVAAKSVDLVGGAYRVMDVRVERDPQNASLLVELKDRDIGTAWDYHMTVLRGLESESRLELLIPIASVLIFMGILVYGLRQLKKGPGPYQIFPVFFPHYEPEPPAEEEVIIVPKKKKYYYTK